MPIKPCTSTYFVQAHYICAFKCRHFCTSVCCSNSWHTNLQQYIMVIGPTNVLTMQSFLNNIIHENVPGELTCIFFELFNQVLWIGISIHVRTNTTLSPIVICTQSASFSCSIRNSLASWVVRTDRVSKHTYARQNASHRTDTLRKLTAYSIRAQSLHPPHIVECWRTCWPSHHKVWSFTAHTTKLYDDMTKR